ncbi:N-succinylarginine dihydrolase [Catenovulum sp. SM1970]|uniref:N-succinylarginine dihydrolase n=1 Tax=Marinifaba aquimaris TaxID=2741323 RepID=UPI0015749247|nr:N-succinylarginine dihydrolase [Marinifaba aquimaris]NTS75981.1 N-succinylarginine dihydrolase [Marinifaba aquimaris]
MKYYEINFDGLVGPSHNYAGLSLGNLASKNNANLTSTPKAAALQGLEKMRTLIKLGLKQGVLPPLARPNLTTLQQLGFNGDIEQMLKAAYEHEPALLASAYSASNMWVANAATVSASPDTQDNKVNFTPANLVSQFHRSIEAVQTQRNLKHIFNNTHFFHHHDPLPAHQHFADEGAANHTRLTPEYGKAGLSLFVYGQSIKEPENAPKKFPARQTLEACQAIARAHQLTAEQTVYIKQNPDVIDAGVFHNDVIAVGNLNVLFYHQDAFEDTKAVQTELNEKWAKISDKPLYFVEVPREQVSVSDAVKSYLFNTQLIALNDNEMALIAPTECQQTLAVHDYLTELVNLDNPIAKVVYQDVKQSMRNGGGPACLRLRVCLNEAELAAVNPNFVLDEAKIDALKVIVEQHYPETLDLASLANVDTYQQIQKANQALAEFFEINEEF